MKIDSSLKKKVLPVLVVIILIIILSIAWFISILKERKAPTDERMDSFLYYGMTQEEKAYSDKEMSAHCAWEALVYGK